MFGAVILFGSAMSAIYTTDTRWMYWHFSRLGEGGHLSSIVFNVSMAIAGVLMFALGRQLTLKLREIDNRLFNTLYAESLLNMVFNVTAICLIGVSLFPFDRYPVIHNSFGYGMTFMMLAMFTLVPKYVPIFPALFYRYGYIVLLISSVLFGLFFALQPYTLLQVEVVVFILIYIWMVVFVKTLYDFKSLKLNSIVIPKKSKS